MDAEQTSVSPESSPELRISDQRPIIITTSFPSAPKLNRIANAYMLFCKKRRKDIIAQHPKLPSRDITRLLAYEWKQLTPEERDVYNQEYIADLEKERRKFPKKEMKPVVLQVVSRDGVVVNIPAFAQT